MMTQGRVRWLGTSDDEWTSTVEIVDDGKSYCYTIPKRHIAALHVALTAARASTFDFDAQLADVEDFVQGRGKWAPVGE